MEVYVAKKLYYTRKSQKIIVSVLTPYGELLSRRTFKTLSSFQNYWKDLPLYFDIKNLGA